MPLETHFFSRGVEEKEEEEEVVEEEEEGDDHDDAHHGVDQGVGFPLDWVFVFGLVFESCCCCCYACVPPSPSRPSSLFRANSLETITS